MQNVFKMVSRRPGAGMDGAGLFTREIAEKVRSFHSTFPMYRPTPLAVLPDTAKALGLGAVYVKDEAHRFGLNAFKVLGGSYAVGRVLARQLGIQETAVSYEQLTSPQVRQRLGEITLVTATDGNHGRGVAWTARQFGLNCVVYLPRGSARERLENIRAEGAKAEITELNYDDAVRLSKKNAEEQGWVVIQDTAWEGYEEIPRWIMEGYCTMGLEAWEQLPEKPTHIFLQAGVGAMAGAMAGLFTALYGEEAPLIAVVEPNKADCLYRTALADDGNLHTVSGDLDTIMAGLACGEPCSLGWQVLSECADFFLSCPDYAAAEGMRLLAQASPSVISGESGAAAFGCVAQIMTDPALVALKQQLCLDAHSRVLFISTEGATDRENYRAIVQEGKYPAPPREPALETILRDHACRYPRMEPRDAVKLIYQNEFGGGHLIRDEKVCLDYLRREYAETEKNARIPPWEDIGNGILRVNLAALPESALVELGRVFIRSAAEHKGTPDTFLAKLEILREVTREGIFAFDGEELECYLDAYTRMGFPPVSHSAAYREAYKPAYRVVRRDIFREAGLWT